MKQTITDEEFERELAEERHEEIVEALQSIAKKKRRRPCG